MAKKILSFEAALKGLEDSLEAVKSDNTSLEELLVRFEEGMDYYEKCKEHLTAANKKIQVYDKMKQELSDFSE